MYIDTSAFVKLYVREPDSETCEKTVLGHTLVSSRLLACEFRSALLGKESRGAISSQTLQEAWHAFQEDLAVGALVLVPLEDTLVTQAGEIMESLHREVPLRTFDALHLATYMSLESGSLFTRDTRMAKAARLLGLKLAA